MHQPTVALFLTTLLPLSLAMAGPAAAAVPAATPSGACADATGVSVVVDLTDLDGDIVVGCAQGDPATGREALVDAGFVVGDDAGMICAINSAPDPCPTTFEGSYWSYWSATPTGDWTAYAVGADSSDPAPGEIEGWRYNDGSAGPGLAPAALEPAAPAAATATADESAAPVADDPAEASGPSGGTFAGLGVVALLLATAVAVLARRRRTDAPSADDGRG